MTAFNKKKPFRWSKLTLKSALNAQETNRHLTIGSMSKYSLY